MMLCPNDHMVMNYLETEGLSIHKCPVCGSVRVAGADADRLVYGGVKVQSYYLPPVTGTLHKGNS